MTYDEIIAEALPYKAHLYVQPMTTLELREFILRIDALVRKTPRTDPQWQNYDLIAKGALSELTMPHRMADQTALMPAPVQDPEFKPLNVGELATDMTALMNKHGIDMRCRMTDWRLTDFVLGVLDALAQVSGARITSNKPRPFKTPAKPKTERDGL